MWKDEDELQTVTFGEFLALANRQAARMTERGVGPGDRVIVIMPQGISLMTAFAGAMLLGAVPAILAYPNFKVEPSKYRAGISGVMSNLNARLLLLDEAFPPELLDAISSEKGPEILQASRLCQAPTAELVVRHSARPDDLAFIQFSAGTTGLQKGVALSHGAVLRQLRHLGSALKINEKDRIYSWLPLYHDMGLIACFMLPLVFHIPVVMQAPTEWVVRPVTMLQLISAYRCTLSWVPNFALQFLARRVRIDDRAGLDLSSLRAMVNCSEPVIPESMDEFLAAYTPHGLRPDALQSSYAMAENVFAVTQSGTSSRPGPRRITVNRERFRNGHIAVADTSDDAMCFISSGICLPGSEARIVSPGGQDLPAGAVGEILIRSDSLFGGYYNRPDLTAAVFRDGWYWSGDLGFCLDDELFVIGRKKDLIIVAGKNIYPQDIEEIICSHPAIHDGRAVAFGLYNQDLGTEDIVAVAEVETEEELPHASLIERAIRQAVFAELGVAVRTVYLKQPRWIVKSTAGKPARADTRNKLLGEHPDLLESSSIKRAT
jgi:acyl-CoA synthetase (AMP-forming)/AMP-acid ligase II